MRKILGRAFFSLSLISLMLIGFAPAHAQNATPGGGTVNSAGVTPGGGTVNSGTGLQSPLKDADLVTLLNDILDFVITIGGIAVVLMLIYCGFKFIAAQGNEEKIREARGMLLWTVIGALVLLGARAIESGIQATIQSLTT